MKLTVRLTRAFADINVDENETTVSSLKEIEDMIDNLTDVIDDLKSLKELKFKLETK